MLQQAHVREKISEMVQAIVTWHIVTRVDRVTKVALRLEDGDEETSVGSPGTTSRVAEKEC